MRRVRVASGPAVRRGCLVLVSLALLASCSGAKGSEQLTWNDLDSASIAKDTDAAVFFSYIPEEPGNGTVGGTVAFIDGQGRTKTLATGKLPNGQIAIDEHGSITWASESTSYLVTSKRKYRVRRGDRQGVGYTVQARNGVFTQMFNGGSGPGGYATDVYGWDGKRWLHTGASITPGQSAVVGRTAYIANMTIQTDGERRMLKVRAGKPASTVARWTTKGQAQGWQLVGLSELMVAHGKAWFLENVAQVRDGEKIIKQPDGSRSRLRLASVDLASGRYETRDYRGLRSESNLEDAKGVVNLASFTSGHHLYRDRIYYVNGLGRLCSVGLKDAKERCAERRFSSRVRGAQDMYGAWRGGELTFLIADKRAWLETYSVDSAKRVRTQRLKGLERFMADNVQRSIYWFALRP